MELHHPIMSKLWDLGRRTIRKDVVFCMETSTTYVELLLLQTKSGRTIFRCQLLTKNAIRMFIQLGVINRVYFGRFATGVQHYSAIIPEIFTNVRILHVYFT